MLKAIHVGLPENGTPETYAWFRAGMQTPVKADSKSDMAVAYVTNQVLGANAMEITAVLSYSQCALETLPNNAYPKKWLCWQPKPPEGSKAPEFKPINIDDNVYKFYTDDKLWHRLINPGLVGSKKKKEIHNFNYICSLADKSSSFMHVLSMTAVCNKTDKFITGKNSKPSTRDKIVWVMLPTY